MAGLESTAPCPVCAEVEERSALYGRWLINENYADGATLTKVASARGYCSGHARKLFEAAPDAATSMARYVVRAIGSNLHAQLTGSRGYRNALDPQQRCPWCATESAALVDAIDTRRGRSSSFCLPHARAAVQYEHTGRIRFESPQPPCPPLEPPKHLAGPLSAEHWWAPSIEELWRALAISCPSCIAAREAGTRREAFLRRGPVAGEHWDVPTLCVEHDEKLGRPRSAAFLRQPDDTERVCDCCSAEQRAAHRTAALGAIAFMEPSFAQASSRVAGFCLPHAREVIAAQTAHGAFAHAALGRIDAMLWELDEYAARGSWMLRDQGQYEHVADLPARAWWLVAGGSRRSA